MKSVLSLNMLSTFLLNIVLVQAQVQVGPAAVQPSAIVAVNAADKGMLLPRLSSIQRTSIVSPPVGLLVYDITTNAVWHYTQAGWMQQYDSLNTSWRRSGTGLFNTRGLRWGINTNNTLSTAHIHSAVSAAVKFTNSASGQGNFDGAAITQTSTGDVSINNAETGGISFINGAGGLSITNTGDIGISTANTVAPVTFNNSSQEKINFYNTSATESYGIGVQGNSMQIHVDRPVSKTEFGYGRTSTGVISRLSVYGNGEVQIPNQLRRPLIYGNTDLLPIAFGKVTSDGGIISGTGNFTVAQMGNGYFNITINGEDIGSNAGKYIIMVTPFIDSTSFYNIPGAPVIIAEANINNSFGYFSVALRSSPYVDYFNTQCQGNFCSVIQTSPESTFATDAGINFIVYKN